MEGGGNLEAQIETLLNVEKQMRLNGDVAGTKKAATDILRLCFEARAWKTLNDQIVLLSKRRGQLKQAVTAMVQQAMQYIDETPDVEAKTELIKTLNSVSAGKIYVEIERARLIKILAKIKEQQGNIAKAADLMQEVADRCVIRCNKQKRYLAVPPPDTMQQAKKIDEEILQEVLKMGFDRSNLVESLRNRVQNEGTVAYYLLLDNRFRVSSGYLGAEFQESMDGFNRMSSNEPASPIIVQRIPGYVDYQGTGFSKLCKN